MRKTSKFSRKCLLPFSLLLSLALLNACEEKAKTGMSKAPGTPTDLTLVGADLSDDLNTGDVMVSWKAPTDAGTKDDGTPATIIDYQVEYTSAADFSDADKVKTVEVSGAKATLKGLNARGTVWKIRVFARNASKKPLSVASRILDVKVGKESSSKATFPAPATQVTFTALSETAIVANFTPSADGGLKKDGTTKANITGYKLIVSDQEDFSNVVAENTVENGDASSVSVAGLTASTTYYAQLITLSDNDDPTKREAVSQVDNSQVTTETTPGQETSEATSPVPATQVTFTALSETAIAANFTPSADGGLKKDGTTKANIAGYKLIVSDQEDFGNVVAENTVENGDASSVSVAGLTASTTYYAQLITLSDNDDPTKKEAVSQVDNSQVTTLPPGASKPALKPAVPAVFNATLSGITLSITVDTDAENLFGTDAKGVAYNKGIYRLEQTTTDPAGGTATYSNTGKAISLTQKSQRVFLLDLAFGTSYWFRIVAIPIDESQNELTGLSVYGNPVKATTNVSEATSPASATRVYLDNRWEYNDQGDLFEKVTASFTPSTDGGTKADGTTEASITGYKLVISDKEDFSNVVAEKTVANVLANTEPTVSITGLNPSTFYYATLITLSDNDDPTKRETSTPGKGLAKHPLTPKDPTVVSTTPTSITLSIAVDTDNAKYRFGSNAMGLPYTGTYLLWIKDSDGSYRDTGKAISLDLKSQNITVSGLTPGTDYDFFVQLTRKDEYQQILSSSSGSSITATTAASKETVPVKPPTMTVKTITDTTITLTVSGTSTTNRFGTDSVGNVYEGEYQIYYKESAQDEDAYSLFKKVTSYSGTNQESFTEDYDIRVVGLTANTPYDFKIVAAPVDENKNVISGKKVDGDETTEKTYPEQPENSYKFTYNKHLYFVVNSPNTWSKATEAAVALGGHLVYIDSLKEQEEIEAGLAQAITDLSLLKEDSKQIAFDGGGVAYVWIGATDSDNEGTWVWDDDDAGTASIAIGSYSDGSFTPVKGGFENFGKGGNPPSISNEPDDYLGLQDFAGIALENWPLGTAYQWNDIKGSNTMPYIIEIER